jgi:hypothetical protein
MLTYDRLLARMQTLSTTTTTHFEGERLRLLQNAIKSVFDACEAGLKDDHEVLSPGALKHWLERKVKSIHAQFDEPLQEQHSSTLNKRKRTVAKGTPAKRQKCAPLTPMNDVQVAAALLELCSSSPPRTPPYPATIEPDKLRIIAGRKIYTPFPTVDRKKGPKSTFFAGVQYAMDNINKHSRGDATFMEKFPEYVRAELAVGKMDERTVERTESEVTAAEGLLGMFGCGHSGGRAAGQVGGHIEDENVGKAAGHGAGHAVGQTAEQVASKSF